LKPYKIHLYIASCYTDFAILAQTACTQTNYRRREPWSTLMSWRGYVVPSGAVFEYVTLQYPCSLSIQMA